MLERKSLQKDISIQEKNEKCQFRKRTSGKGQFWKNKSENDDSAKEKSEKDKY